MKPRTGVSTKRSSRLSRRGPWIAATSSAGPVALPSSQITTATSSTRSRIVAGFSGSARAGSIPAPSIAARPSSSRLVPRTAQPSSSSWARGARPLHPQPRISARATSGGLAGGEAAQVEPTLFLVGAGAGAAVDVVGVDRLAADRAGRHHVEGVVLVDDLERRPVLGRVAVAPGEQREEQRLQVAPLLGQHVLEALRVLAVAAALDDPLLGQRRQPRAEHVGGDAERGLELVEAAAPEEEVAEDQDGPALAEEGQRFGDRAVLLVVGLDAHTLILAVTLLLKVRSATVACEKTENCRW